MRECPVIQKRKTLLHREVRTLGVDGENLVVDLLRHVTQVSELADASVYEQHIDLVELIREGLEEVVDLFDPRDPGRHAYGAIADRSYGVINCGF